ncbi:MAG TPA: LLM class F420-dependent oxidoreductase [Stellaceae bacterium]|jgi:probable F420-dependent oxidoreductase|nr:LLM class F420-dependent oxidoreductase [Stellaceae bacterium]
MKLGVALPLIDVAVGGDPTAIREFAQVAEEIGYQDLSAPDHVLGVNVASRPDWGDRNTSADLFHDPFVLFAFLAGCTRNVEFSTQVLILAQRQAVLVAKQAASLDVLCGGRFRLGIGVGWNPVEFVALNENFHNRGRRSEEQVEIMQALWAEPHVSFAGQYHTIEDAGINPLPPRRKIPIWYGGHAEATLHRVVKWGDGWMPMAYGPGQEAAAAIARLRGLAEAAGRDPASIGIDTRVTAGIGTEAEWRAAVRFWKSQGVTHLTLATYSGRGHLRRIAGRTLPDHLAAIKRYWNAVADLL